jgi:hypothetical protein
LIPFWKLDDLAHEGIEGPLVSLEEVEEREKKHFEVV